MGLSNIGMSELLIILVIVMLLFGTKRLKTLGSDLGTAIRGFRRAMDNPEPRAMDNPEPNEPPATLPALEPSAPSIADPDTGRQQPGQ